MKLLGNVWVVVCLLVGLVPASRLCAAKSKSNRGTGESARPRPGGGPDTTLRVSPEQDDFFEGLAGISDVRQQMRVPQPETTKYDQQMKLLELERQRIDLERKKIDLEREKIDLEKNKFQRDGQPKADKPKQSQDEKKPKKLTPEEQRQRLKAVFPELESQIRTMPPEKAKKTKKIMRDSLRAAKKEAKKNNVQDEKGLEELWRDKARLKFAELLGVKDPNDAEFKAGFNNAWKVAADVLLEASSPVLKRLASNPYFKVILGSLLSTGAVGAGVFGTGALGEALRDDQDTKDTKGKEKAPGDTDTGTVSKEPLKKEKNQIKPVLGQLVDELSKLS